MKTDFAKRNSFIIVVLFLFTTLLSSIPNPAAVVGAIPNNAGNDLGDSVLTHDEMDIDGEENKSDIALLAADGSELSFTISVPWEQLTLESTTIDGKSYVKPSLPGWADMITAGAPALPVHIEQIGVPFSSEVNISVIPGKQHVVDLGASVLPVATQINERDPSDDLFENSFNHEPEKAIIEDPAVYNGNLQFPGLLAEITGDGVLRQQRVVAVSAYPFQYDPSANQLIVYESLQVNVQFSGNFTQSRGTFSSDSAVYEELLSGELLNYESAKTFRSSTSASFEQLDTDGLSQSLAGAPIPWAPPESGYRITVQEDGFYKITYAELADPGLGIQVDSLDPRTFQMFYLGNEIAIEVDGEDDGSFDSGDTILFYGEGITSKYTKDNIYWLTYGQTGVTQGERIGTRDGTPGSASIPAYYWAQRHMEVNNYYITWMPFPEDVERWWWGAIQAPNTPSWTHSFTLLDPYTGTLESGDDPAEITVSLVGYTAYSTINPDHHARIFVNSVAVGDMLFDGRSWKLSSFEIDQGVLHAGSNSVEVRWINDTGAASDIMLVDYIELSFPNQFSAESDELDFSYETPGTWQFSVDGFSIDQVSVYDITDPWDVVSMANVSISSSGSEYTAAFEDTLSDAANFWALADTAYYTVLGIVADNSSTLRYGANGADHITITHEDFWTQAVTLTTHRSSSMRAVTVDLQDVYDEFNFGIADPVAIHNFLAFAYDAWQAPAPSYVVLMGDGHYDPKQNYFTQKINYISPYLLPVDPWIGETASDNRLVTIVGEDALPDMMIGRLAVNNATEAAAMVTKIINYETAPVAGDWQESILAVADNMDVAGNFPGLSDYLMNTYVGSSYTVDKIYFGQSPYTLASTTRTAIINGINAGRLFVNYIGHGSTKRWADENILLMDDIATLTNGYKLPVFLEMTCYTGYFHDPQPTQDGMAEVESRAAGKGSIASWAATGESVTSGHLYLDSGFFETFFQNGIVAVGDATLRGKFELWSSGGALDLLDTYTLFGDPALVIVRPETTNNPPMITEGSSVVVNMSENATPVAFSLTLHATDPDGDSLSWHVSGEALHGDASATGTGNSIAVSYTPDSNFSGSDVFVIEVSDGSLADQIVVNVLIGAINNPPVAVDDTASTNKNTPLVLTTSQLKANDSDPDNPLSELSITGVSNPVNGVVSMVGDTITFTPDTDFIGTAGFDYTLSDGELTDAGHVTVNINFINTAPVAMNDAYVTAKNQTLTISAPGVLGNDHDPEGFPITAELVSNPSAGSLAFSTDGSFVYTPKKNATGSVTFTYVAYDGVHYSTVAVVTITVLDSLPIVSIPLVTGWNLISFNIQPSSTVITDVLNSIDGNYTLVNAWDATTDTWLLYDPAAPSYANDLETLDHTIGFWVFMSAPDTLVVSGMPPTTTNINLRTGWNLVGYPSMDPLTLPGALSDNGVTDYSMVMAFHANETETWKTYDPTAPSYANNLLEITPNWGYWINVSSDSTWTIPYDQP